MSKKNWKESLKRFFELIASLWKSFWRSLEMQLLSKSRNIPANLPKRRRVVANAILEHPHHQDFLHRFSQESGIPLEAVESTFRRYVNEIASDLHYAIFPFWDFVLGWVFNFVYEGLEINTKVLDKIRETAGKKPLVFVSSHRSHMDYLLLSYIFYQQRLPMPLICAGENLSFWPLGPIFRKSGAFFIRRSYEGNKLYAAAMQAYVEEMIRDRVPVEFFIEGTRSRTGKLLPPKTGFLSTLVQSFEQNVAEDVVFVPTSITYDSVMEEKSYLSEQTGSFKKDESLRDLWQLRKFLKTKKGKVYIQFGEPLSLATFLKDHGRKGQRERTRQLAFELTYGINRSAVVTPAALVAMAILTHPHRGITRQEIEEKIRLYLHYLSFKECPLSTTLKKYQQAAIRESVRNYVRTGLLEEWGDENEALYMAPQGRRGLLDYYKNTAIHFFVSIGVLASILKGQGSDTVPLSRVEEDYVFLQDLLQFEFTFSRRQPLRHHLERLLDYLTKTSHLTYDQSTVFLKDSARQTLVFFTAPLAKFFEAYYVLWRSLPFLESKRWEQTELVKTIRHRIDVAFLKEEIHHPESNSRFVVENALKAFRDLGLLVEEKEGWGKRKKLCYTVKGLGVTIGEKLSHLI